MTPERYQHLCELFDQAQARAPEQRAVFLQEVGAAHPTLCAELESMLADDQKARGERLLQEPCPVNARVLLPGDSPTIVSARRDAESNDTLVGGRVGPYLVEARVGHGGMGSVYRALRQGEYRQRVALKVIRPGLASEEVLHRFRTERQVLAELEHPHIARLLDGGCTEDGRPYFVMEYIDGEPLHRYCESRQLGTRERVELLRSVCAAVRHAHECGVLHRDLKPDNVLVTTEGTPKVTDFGLAKRLDADSDGPAQTQTGAVLGTPSYMAPEQAAGQRAKVGVATDVYALGAVLYELLTGRPPFRSETPLETLQQVLSDEPVPPGQLHPKLARDLETICLKCLQKDPARRYATVAALADDLRRFHGGEPILARPVGRAERLWRWCRRNPAAASAAALLVTATLGLAVGLWVVNNARQETEDALGKVEQEQQKTAQALELSQKAEKNAGTQRQLALKTLRGVIEDIQARLKDKPGQAGLRKALLARAQAGLSEVARAADTAAMVDHETIWVHIELGDIFLRIEEGGTAEGKVQYDTAQRLARQVWEVNPENKLARRDLNVCHNKLGDVCLVLLDYRTALDNYKKALDLSRPLADEHPRDANLQRDLAVSLTKVGDVCLKLDDLRVALGNYKPALDIAQRLADLDRNNDGAQRDLSVAYNKLGNVQLRLGQGQSALDSYRNAMEIRQRLARAYSNSLQAQRDLMVSHLKLGDVHVRLGDARAALDSYKAALEICQGRAGTDPKDAQTQRDLDACHIKAGDMCLLLGDSDGALNNYKGGEQISRRRATVDKANVQAQTDLFVDCWKLGKAEKARCEYAKAAEWFGKAASVLKPLQQAGRLSGRFKGGVRDAEREIAVCRAVPKVVADPAHALQLTDDLRRPVLAASAHALAVKGKQPAKAIAAADLLAKNAERPDDLYAAACGYALSVPLADSPESTEKYAARAVELLRQAVEQGYRDLAHVKHGADLAALHERDDFRKLVANLEAATNSEGSKEP
jgi:tetratricopeptide (TPR) repeat protein